MRKEYPLTLTLSHGGERGIFVTSSPLGERIEVWGKQTTETNFHVSWCPQGTWGFDSKIRFL
jgi:hypothetical protein